MITDRDIERILLELVDEGFASMYTDNGVRCYELLIPTDDDPGYGQRLDLAVTYAEENE